MPTQLAVSGSTLFRNNSVVANYLTDDTQIAPSNVDIKNINYDPNIQEIIVNRLTVPMNNCGGNAIVSQNYTQSQTLIHEYHADIGAGISIPVGSWIKVIPELQANFGYEQGQIETKTLEYNMATDPGTNVTYVITWKEIWETGSVDLLSGTDTVSFPFRARTDLVYQIDSEDLPCP